MHFGEQFSNSATGSFFSLYSSAGCFTIAEEGKAFGRATRVYLNLNYDMLLVVKKRNKVEISCTQTGKFQQSRSPKELSDSISQDLKETNAEQNLLQFHKVKRKDNYNLESLCWWLISVN